MSMLHLVFALTLLQQTPPEESESVAERERVARLVLEAAQSGEFYFLVDMSGATLRLALRGVVLETFAMRDVSLGRLVGAGYSGEGILTLRSCETGVTETPIDIIPGQSLPEPGPAVPPASWFTIGCGPDLSIHLDSESAAGVLHYVRERIRLASEPEVDARLRIVLADEEYARLVAAMPPKSSWIVSP